MAAAAIHDLEFYQNAMLGPNEPRMANVYLHTKFHTNIFIDHRDRPMAQKYKSTMAAAASFNFIKSGI